ncbi:hypothetical protein LXA43DRAFT_1062875 [Ganoderma leucocontextum]|nr:hypothetical protein LXA43DRAFT_1062875 [Ganoderma leucocontextum]
MTGWCIPESSRSSFRRRPEGRGEAGATVATREQDVKSKSERGGQYGRMVLKGQQTRGGGRGKVEEGETTTWAQDTNGSIVTKSVYDSQDLSPLFLYAGPSTLLLQVLMAADDCDNTLPTSSSSSRPKLKLQVELWLKAHSIHVICSST